MVQLGLFPPILGHGSSVVKQGQGQNLMKLHVVLGPPRIPVLKFILHSDEQNPKMLSFIGHCICNGVEMEIRKRHGSITLYSMILVIIN